MSSVAATEFANGTDSRRTRKLSERIAHRIVDYIVDNNLTEGTMLPVESQLVSALEVGRNTLREALLLLETWGVVTIKPGRNGGPAVRLPRPGDLREALALQLHFASATLRDVSEAREALEPMSARLATTRITAADLDEVDRTVERMRANLDSQAVFLEENRRFHSIIAESTGSVIVHAFIDTMKVIADGAVAGVQYGRRDRAAVADAHERVAVAMRAGDSGAAEAAMRAHVAEATAYWDEHANLASGPLRWTS